VCRRAWQYYSALEGNPRHYLMARAIQFWTPGIPMVYYVGLLAGRNDHKVNHRAQSWPTRVQQTPPCAYGPANVCSCTARESSPNIALGPG